MFYENNTITYSDRFDLAQFLDDTSNDGNFILTDSYFINELRKLQPSASYTTTGERPDVMSYNIYQDVQYYEILMLYNDVVDFSKELPVGTVITYPSISDLETLLYTIVAKQKSNSSTITILE